MVRIVFQNRATEKKALGFLLGRFSGRVLAGGEHLVPEAALEALAEQNISFSVKGKASYEQQVAAIRGAASTPVQRRRDVPAEWLERLMSLADFFGRAAERRQIVAWGVSPHE